MDKTPIKFIYLVIIIMATIGLLSAAYNPGQVHQINSEQEGYSKSETNILLNALNQ